jgi:hypothetical protein
VCGDLAVGALLAMFDDQAVGKDSTRDLILLKLSRGSIEMPMTYDFVGIQNYERTICDDKGKVARMLMAVKMIGIGHSTPYQLFNPVEITAIMVGSSRLFIIECLKDFVERQRP